MSFCGQCSTSYLPINWWSGWTRIEEFYLMIWYIPTLTEKSGIAMCVGCGSQIHDQYIMRVSPDLEWHAACLKCAECSQYLDETCTCFVRDGKTYCKRDYARWGIQDYFRLVSSQKKTKKKTQTFATQMHPRPINSRNGIQPSRSIFLLPELNTNTTQLR